MIWNNDTKRLEFEDGTPVGALPLNDALKARGKRPRRDHLVETQQAVERRGEEDVQVKNLIKRLGRHHKKNPWQVGQDNICKPNASSKRIHGMADPKAERGYRAGILDTDYFA